jgi:uncharacterized protein DUF2877
LSAVVREPIALPYRQRPRPSLEARPVVGGAASAALRGLLETGRDACPIPARVIAVFPSAVYLQVTTAAEPRVLALVAGDAVRLPNALVVATSTRERPFRQVREGEQARVGDGSVEIGALRVRARRWWDPRPRLGPVSAAGLARGLRALEASAAAHCAAERFGLAGHPDPGLLAGHCAAGELADAVETAERIVGLGPGLTPTGDDVLAALLVTLRTLGGSMRHGGSAMWLADWLGAAVTADADTRTTALAATLLHCAARGEASAEVAAVLRGVAGLEPLDPAVRRLVAAGHTSGADLAYGLLAGCRAVLTLSLSELKDQRASA